MKKSLNDYTGWNDIDWSGIYDKVAHIQKQIRVTWNSNEKAVVSKFQHDLVNSWAARALAVRVVTTNKGKKTPGVDQVVWDSPKQKWEAIERLHIDRKKYVCSPVRRVYIQKANGGLRPLGIPTMYDRRTQAQWKMALDPVAECTGDRHSYGFRTGRSTKDAQTFLHLLIGSRWRPMWIIDADIKGFFDNISHKWILDNIPMNKLVLFQWLKAGALDLTKGEYLEGESGVPQGGIISPTIANMVLDGLQGEVQDAVKHLRSKKRVPKAQAKGTLVPGMKVPKMKTEWSPKVNLVRYRDDFVITAATKRILHDLVKPVVKKFLAKRGLELNDAKTITVSVKEGVDFLGYNFRIYPYTKRHTGYIALTKPTKKGLKRLLNKIKQAIKTNEEAGSIIVRQNPILRGWANYYAGVTAKRTFVKIGYYLWIKLWKWRVKKHSKQPGKDIQKMYFKTVGSRHWVFYGKYQNKELLLYDIRNTPIRRHVQIKDCNPYLPEDAAYFEQRMLKGVKYHPQWDSRRLAVVKKSKCVCLVCERQLKADDQIELHHIKPQKLGGSDEVKNLVALHRVCHVQVTHTKSQKLLVRFKKIGVLDLGD